MSSSRYSHLPSQPPISLQLEPLLDDPAQDSDTLDRRERGRGRFDDDDETDFDREGNEARGILSGLKSERPEEETHVGHVRLDGKSKAWLGRVNIRLRPALLSLLGITVLLLLLLLFHPSSPASSLISNYYHGATHNGQVLTPGTWSDKGVLADNPLDPDGKFGDVPFASLATPKATATTSPELSKETKDWDLRSNGTHSFAKTVILVSLDGVRADYLDKGLTPHLLSISKRGLRAQYLESVFPSLTFPNHWSLMTGLYPASHGIVANDFVDPVTGLEFVYTNPAHSWDSRWWGGEPLWSTAVKNGLRSAVLMWPGPPVMKDGVQPTLWYPFENHFKYQKKLDRITSWLDMPFSTRPHLITAYIPEVDQEGHRSGPHSHQVETTLLEVDTFAKGLWSALEERNLTGIVDVIFVSDHGMSDTHNERIVFLDDILGEEGFAGLTSCEGWPSAGLRFEPHINTTDMLERLATAAAESTGGFHVYTEETMPAHWNFASNERIAPIYVVPHVGWAVSNREEFHVKMKGEFRPKGIHGYDPADPSMRAIFVAHGPFADSLKLNRSQPLPMSEETLILPGFRNLEVYNLVTDLLDIDQSHRAPNNGTEGFWERVLERR